MKKVLIVDDEKSSSEIISYFIKEYDLPMQIVGSVSRGDLGLEAVKHFKPDIVFLDIEMPVMNGLQMIEEVQRSSQRNIAYVIITAYNKFDYAQKALRLGAKDILLKPVQYEQFCETMHRVIGYQYTDNPLFNQMLEYIHEHYTEDISLSSCADALATSVNNISRMLKKYLDSSFTVYYNKLRIEKAMELLSAGASIKEVVINVGYNNLNYFYRKFKDQVGVTPKEYVSNMDTSEH